MTNTLLGQNDHYDKKVQGRNNVNELLPNHRMYIYKEVEHFVNIG